LLAQVLRRLDAGEYVSDDDLIAAHAHLMPELGDELIALRRIRRAYLTARKAGPMDSPVPLLSDEQLEAPIVLPEEDRFSTAACGPRIQGYTVLNEIGAGGQATVFKAIHEGTSRVVAIKVMLGGALAGSRHRARFDREVSILAQIDHPNVVSVIDRGCTEDGSYFFAMNYVDGVPLDEYRPEGGTPSDEVWLRLWMKVALAVEEAHSRGIVHRDLKPSNILVDKRGEPCVMDFGLARPLAGSDRMPNAHTQTGQIVGSLPWASPEQARGDVDGVDVRSDVYSLGVLFYENLTGEFPYSVTGSMSEVVKNITTVQPAPPTRHASARNRALVSPEVRRAPGERASRLDTVLLKALAKNPADRYQTAAAFARDLGHVLAGQKIAARRPSRWVHVLRSPWRVALILAVIGALPAAAVWWNQRPPSTMSGSRPAPVANFIGMQFVLVPAQEFKMGSEISEAGRDATNEQLHTVRLSHTIYMGAKEVTQNQFHAVMDPNPSTQPSRGKELPMQRVSWQEAVNFCKKLGENDPQHRTYRLPTEAEWECACRAGDTLRTPGDTPLGKVGWFSGNSEGRLHPVAALQANACGIFDMRGNVAEWCSDWYAPDYGTKPLPIVIDPAGPKDGSKRVVRGGDFTMGENDCRAASRSGLDPVTSLPTLGFRVVMDDPAPKRP
jgi:serine/threonine protein kinase